jgi:guanine deaminase
MFKAEARIDQDLHFAKKICERLVSRMLESRTTAASVFGTISVEAK